MRITRVLFVVSVIVALAVAATPSQADDDTVLLRVTGGVGYTAGAGAPYAAVIGQQLMQDGYFAVVKQRAQAMLLLPDSSQVGLGGNTVVQVSAFMRAESGAGSTIGIPSTGGVLRFNIKHPKGSKASYTFVTPSTNIAVRGTSGLLWSSAHHDIIACLDCSAHSLVVTTADGKTYELRTGQMLDVSPKGTARSATTQKVLQMFADAGLTTDPSAAMPVVAANPNNMPSLTNGPATSRNPGVPPPTATNGITTR